MNIVERCFVNIIKYITVRLPGPKIADALQAPSFKHITLHKNLKMDWGTNSKLKGRKIPFQTLKTKVKHTNASTNIGHKFFLFDFWLRFYYKLITT